MSSSRIHRRINNILSMAVAGLGVYLVLLPWLPYLSLYYRQAFNDTPAYAVNLTQDKDQQSAANSPVEYPKDNRLVIPKIALDSGVFSGQSAAELNKGPWLRPNTSNPAAGGNTVIAGHRYAYGIDGKWIFYHLDKLEVGDRIGVYWEGREYIYEVGETKVVPATAIEIEDQTENGQLTLYTCTPLWTAENRLVVVADLIEVNE